ncbi:MAG: HigA family addiction module antidote protein [Actinobacteria bacterium]|nr:HigA family addiction module antidote protein [Actinomycetota bacterium]
MAARSHGQQRDWIVSPGEILAEALEERGMSQSELARRMGRPVKTINEIIHAKATVTPETALQLELVLGIPASLWVNLEGSYRRHLAERETFAAFAGLADWLKQFPVKDLARHGFMDRNGTTEKQVRQLLAFFGTASPEALERRWGEPLAQYRKSATYKGSERSRAAWLRWGELLAEDMDLEPVDAGALAAAASQLPRLSRVSPLEAALDEARSRLREVGVALVVLPEFDGTRLSGATRWLPRGIAVIQLSLRHKTDDHLWFSLMHEIGHILDRPRHDFVDALHAHSSDYDDPEAERRADAFARDALIDGVALRSFLDRGQLDAASVRSFAAEMNVSPGIIVGRLQHDEVIPPNRHNSLKKTVDFTST